MQGALRTRDFDAIYASDLKRAWQTAEMIARPQHLSVQRDARLREFDFGAWEGLTWAEIVARWPEFADQGGTVAKSYTPEGGETFAAVCARVAAFLADVRATSFERVLVVTHAGVLHAVLDVLGAAIDDRAGDHLALAFSQASITTIAMEGEQARLITLNDVSHLNTTS